VLTKNNYLFCLQKLSNDFRMRYLQTTGQPATTGMIVALAKRL